MDYTGVSVVTEPTAAAGGSFDNMMWLGVALLIWCFEHRVRGAAPTGMGASKFLEYFAPEAVGLAACAALAAFMISRGEPKGAILPEDQEAWEQIKSQWPLLMTADSLLAIQAMLRFVMLLSAVVRFGGSGRGTTDVGPIVGEPALLFLGAAACRVALLAWSPDHGLEGPLQGPVHFAFEVAAVPLLLRLFVGTTGRRPTFLGVALAAAAAAGAVRFSKLHRLPLADDLVKDSAFTLVHLLELLACAACLIKTVTQVFGSLAGRSPHASLVHALLPLQQALSMYFFAVAFELSMEAACVGRPLLVLQSGGAAQLVLLLLAGALHFAMGPEEPVPAAAAPQPAGAPAQTVL